MTWPVTLTNLTNTDSPGDNPSLARADILQTMQNLNEIINNGVPLLKTDSQLQLATSATTTGIPPAYQAALTPAPARGQHSREILAECGFSVAEIDQLIADGITS